MGLRRVLPLELDLRASSRHASWERRIQSFCYTADWKKLEPLWDAMIRFRRLRSLRPVLESVLSTSVGSE